MDIKVSLPKPEETCGKSIKAFLRQMELSIHHLNKSVEEMEKEGELTDTTFIIYRFPFLERQYRYGENDIAQVHTDESGNQMQEIEIEILTA